MEELTLNIDEIEEKLKSKKKKITFISFITYLGFYLLIDMYVPDYRSHKFLYEFIIITPIITFLLVNGNYYFLLNNIFCPYCNNLYFHPYFASKEQIKSLMKSNPSCVHCSQKANIISDYKILY